MGTINSITPRANDFVIISLLSFSFLYVSAASWTFYKDGKSQKLKRQEADIRNQDKKAIAADNRYLPHNLDGQRETPTPCRISVTLAVEQAAASEKYDRTCHVKINIIIAIS